jgi:hypothetical protein
MLPRCNNGRFATPKPNPREVFQITPEQALIGADHGQSGSDRRISVPRNGAFELPEPADLPLLILTEKCSTGAILINSMERLSYI